MSHRRTPRWLAVALLSSPGRPTEEGERSLGGAVSSRKRFKVKLLGEYGVRALVRTGPVPLGLSPLGE